MQPLSRVLVAERTAAAGLPGCLCLRSLIQARASLWHPRCHTWPPGAHGRPSRPGAPPAPEPIIRLRQPPAGRPGRRGEEGAAVFAEVKIRCEPSMPGTVRARLLPPHLGSPLSAASGPRAHSQDPGGLQSPRSKRPGRKQRGRASGSRWRHRVVFPIGEEDGRDQSRLETKVWEAHNPLIDKQIDQFLVVARSVGTFARALDCSSSVRQPSLHMSAAAASRDITLFHAMDTLHKSVYDVAKAISALVPQGGPVLCRDEMEEWSASEASLFEEALEKYGKDFTDIQQDFLPWKSLTSIIEYYYMWKTTDRYVQQKRLKAAEAESKLKQVYIPNYNKPNPNQISVNNVKAGVVNGAGAPGQSPGAGRACESCYTAQSYQWYSWGPPNMQCRLCASCWTYWKKYGGLKMPTRLDGERPGPNRSNMSPHGIPARSSGSPKFAMKTRQAFYLHTTKLTRIARRLCREILRPWHAARHPYMPINSAAIKAECTARLPEASQSPLVLKQAVRKPLEAVLRYLETHPRPPKPDPVKSVSGVLGGLTPAKSAPVINNGSPTILGKRSYEQHNGVDGESPAGRPGGASSLGRRGLLAWGCPAGPVAASPAPADGVLSPSLSRRRALAGNMKKRLLMPSRGTYLGLANHGQTRHMGPSRNLLLNGKSYPTKVRLIRGGSLPPVKRRRMNWIDAPDDVFYMATEETRKIRKLLSSSETKRAARRPYKPIALRQSQALPLRPPPPAPVNDEPIVIED
uniref:Metastasis associated 1 n=1 Tax=Canis lupus dingo TaxID=286419 RepID=A0A8C0K453_CANLU